MKAENYELLGSTINALNAQIKNPIPNVLMLRHILTSLSLIYATEKVEVSQSLQSTGLSDRSKIGTDKTT